MSSKEIKYLPKRAGSKEITSQGVLNLHIEKETEIQGVGMGVLNDGTPFLTQRGLARLCGVQNAHIGTMGTEWNENQQKPRITTIKEILASRGITVDSPFIQLTHRGQTIYAYPDTVCLAVLEYYAFEAGANFKEEARKNYRLLAGKALQDFIYAQVGYDPNHGIPEVWRQFHDRISLTYDATPHGYFSVFKEIADIVVTLIQAGAKVGSQFVPDISVGQHWAAHWTENELAENYGQRQQYPHNYPDYFPQATSNPQYSHCYPDAALPEFRRWFRVEYLEKKFPNYLMSKQKTGLLPPSFVQLAISAVRESNAKKKIQ